MIRYEITSSYLYGLMHTVNYKIVGLCAFAGMVGWRSLSVVTVDCYVCIGNIVPSVVIRHMIT